MAERLLIIQGVSIKEHDSRKFVMVTPKIFYVEKGRRVVIIE